MFKSGTIALTCPHCSSDRIQMVKCGSYGWMRCQKCGTVWQEEEQFKHDRSALKGLKEGGEKHG